MNIKCLFPFLVLILFGCNPKTEFCDCMNAERNLKDQPECEWIEETLSEAEIMDMLFKCTAVKTDNPSPKIEKENLDVEYQNEESSVRQIEKSVQRTNESSDSKIESNENEAFFE